MQKQLHEFVVFTKNTTGFSGQAASYGRWAHRDPSRVQSNISRTMRTSNVCASSFPTDVTYSMYISISALRERENREVGMILYAKSSLELIVNNRIGKVGIQRCRECDELNPHPYAKWCTRSIYMSAHMCLCIWIHTWNILLTAIAPIFVSSASHLLRSQFGEISATRSVRFPWRFVRPYVSCSTNSSTGLFTFARLRIIK